MADKQVRAQYTQEFKMEAVRQVRGGQAVSVVAKGNPPEKHRFEK